MTQEEQILIAASAYHQMQQQRSDALVPPRWSCGSTWNGRLRPCDSVLGIPGARVGAGSQLTALLNGLKEPISVLLPPRHSSQLQQVSSGEHRRDGHAARPFLSWHLGQRRILAARDVPAPMAFRRSANCHDAIALVPPLLSVAILGHMGNRLLKPSVQVSRTSAKLLNTHRALRSI